MGKKRTKKFRGSRNHGKGIKGGRGAGQRGGRGNAGLGKHKWIKVVKEDPEHFGPKGFTRPQALCDEEKVINIYEVEDRIDSFIENGFAEKVGSFYEVDLNKAGYDKLLSGGKARLQMKIKVGNTSERAVSKVQESGGEIITVEESE